MNVLFVSQCSKRALTETQRLCFANFQAVVMCLDGPRDTGNMADDPEN